MVFRIFFILLFVTHSYTGIATKRDSLVNLVFSDIYNQRFDQAEWLLHKYKSDIDNFYFDVLTLDLHWWKYAVSRSGTDAQNLNLLIKEQIEAGSVSGNRAKEITGKSYELRYARKRFKFFRVQSLRSEIQLLLLDLDRGRLQLTEDELKLFDLYVALFNYSEQLNPFFLWQKTPERKRCLLHLEMFVHEENLIINTMAHYFLGRIYQKVEKDREKAKEHFKQLNTIYPANQLFKAYLTDLE